MIRKATLKDIDTIVGITEACTDDMVGKHIYQWNENYPNRTAFENDVTRGELYVLEVESIIIGCMVISSLIDDEYLPVSWLTPNQNNSYIHRLAIRPDHQGKGYAQMLMDYAETFSIENNYASIRLDTFSQNLRNQKFYELRGYKKLDSIYFPKQSEHPFYCYELIL